MAQKKRILGCNTLFPFGRITFAERSRFDYEAFCRTFDIMRGIGFEAVEVSSYDQLSLDDCERVRGAMEARGLQPWSAHTHLCLPCSESGREKFSARLVRELSGAARLGVQVAVIHPEPGASTAEHWRISRESVREFAEVGGRLGVKIALENCQTSRDQLLHYRDIIHGENLPGFGFNLDSGHCVIHTKMDCCDMLRIMGRKLLTTHLEDNDGQQDLHWPPGRGNHIDWPKLWQTLDEIGYEGVRMVELTDCRCNGDDVPFREEMEETYRFMRSLG